jgi:sulfur dioxygenase
LENFVQLMNNLNLPKPIRIDEAVPQKMKCRYFLELGYDNEDNFTMHDLYQLLNKLNPTERVIDVRMHSEYNQGHVPGSFNIPMGHEQTFIDEILSYDRVFYYCHSGHWAQAVYIMLSMQGLDNLVCINSSGMTDWHTTSFPVEQ